VNDLHAAASQRTAGQTAVAVFEAYRDSDREAAEALIAEEFGFFSPLDNGLIGGPISNAAGPATRRSPNSTSFGSWKMAMKQWSPTKPG
jgi:hypothetical protein